MAGDYGPDYAAAMAGALLQWRSLSPTMQRALVDAPASAIYPTRRLGSVRRPTCIALDRRGLVKWNGSLLTPMGLLVREAGLADQAKRRDRAATGD